MATLRGQNFRILTEDEGNWKCIGMATTCTVTLGTNTDDASTKDDTGMASRPEVTSKNWQVSVEALNVADTAAILTAVKSMKPLTLMWDETENGTDMNQNPEGAAFARQGKAYLSDVTFSFNDRENASKSLQFTGASALSAASAVSTQSTGTPAYTKGQFVRLFLGSDNTATPSAVIAAAKTLQLHVSISLEDATTKDTEGDWQVQEPTGLSYDISTNALVRSGDEITSSVAGKSLNDLQTIYEASTPVKWQIANVSGANQRTKGSILVSGSCIVGQLTINAANKQSATYDASLTGYGDYVVGG